MKDMEVQAEKFELRLKSGYLKINEHEVIVRQLQAKEREAQSSAIAEVQAAKDAQLAQLSNDMRDQAQNEQLRLQQVIGALETRMQEVQEETRRNLDEKDRMWQEAMDSRTKEALQETK